MCPPGRRAARDPAHREAQAHGHRQGQDRHHRLVQGDRLDRVVPARRGPAAAPRAQLVAPSGFHPEPHRHRASRSREHQDHRALHSPSEFLGADRVHLEAGHHPQVPPRGGQVHPPGSCPRALPADPPALAPHAALRHPPPGWDAQETGQRPHHSPHLALRGRHGPHRLPRLPSVPPTDQQHPAHLAPETGLLPDRVVPIAHEVLLIRHQA